jgi:cytochrome b involved in lipid metabolism
LFELDLINGLPAHPLLVHAPVVFVPLTSLGLIALVLFPKFQSKYLNLVSLSALVALGSAILAKQSGEQFAARVGLPVEHAELGEQLVVVTAILAGAVIVWNFLVRTKNNSKALLNLAKYGGAIVALVALFVTYQTGHSGAKATWENRISQGQDQGTTAPTTDPSSESTAESTGITLEELATHNSAQDCWSAVNGKVYDLTEFVNQHPGGSDKIEQICGRDGTSAFNGQHRGEDTPVSTLGNFLVGELAN